LLAVCLVTTNPAGAADTVSLREFAPACTSPMSRALDFWIGEWSVAWSTGDGRSGRAHSTVVVENGGCVIREHFRDLAGGLEGTGIYSYFAPIDAWSQTWMDNQGITIHSTGGPSDRATERTRQAGP
jgi:hypothetical protein